MIGGVSTSAVAWVFPPKSPQTIILPLQRPLAVAGGSIAAYPGIWNVPLLPPPGDNQGPGSGLYCGARPGPKNLEQTTVYNQEVVGPGAHLVESS